MNNIGLSEAVCSQNESKFSTQTKQFCVAYAATFSLLIAIFMAVFFISVRYWADLPVQELASMSVKALAFTGAVCFSPLLLKRMFDVRPWSACIIALTTFLTPVILAFMGKFLLLLIVPVAFVGTLRAVHILQTLSRWQLIGLIVMPVVVAVHLNVWLYKPPNLTVGLFHASILPELANWGQLYTDQYFHTAIVNMISNHGVVTTGVDGLTPFSYHFGAHLWLAEMKKILGSSAIAVNTVVRLVIFIPVALGFFFFAIFLSPGSRLQPPLAYITLGLLLFLLRDALLGWVGVYSSETFLPASMIFLATIPPLLEAIRYYADTDEIPWLHALGLLLLCGLALLSKLHVGLLLLLMVAVFLSCKTGSLGHGLLVGVVAGIAGLLAVYLMSPVGLIPIMQELGYFDLTVNFPSTVCLYLLPALLAGGFMWSAIAVDGPAASGVRLREKYLLSLVTVVPLCLSAAYVMMRSENANAHWFGLTLFLFSGVLTSQRVIDSKIYLSLLKLRRPSDEIASHAPPRALVYSAVLLLCSGGLFLYSSGFYYLTTNYFSYLRSTGDAVRHGKTQLGEKIVRIVRHAAGSDVGSLMVYAPPETTDFWSLVSKCRAKSLFIPALTGVPMLMGLPPSNFGCDAELTNYGYVGYGEMSRTRALTQKQACQAARDKGFERVLVLRSPIGDNTREIWNCRV